MRAVDWEWLGEVDWESGTELGEVWITIDGVFVSESKRENDSEGWVGGPPRC